MQLPGIRHRAYTDDSLESSPIGSPHASQFSDYGPNTTESMPMPRSVPLGFGDEISPLGNGVFTHAGLQFPSAWQMTEDQPLLQYPSPTSANGYLSVNDLAQQIFNESAQISETSMYAQPGNLDASIGRPASIDTLLVASSGNLGHSEVLSTASSPRPTHGPKFLYRSNSGPSQAEPRLMALASEMGLSGYLLSQCVKQWFKHIYPIQPVLHEATITRMLNQSEELSTQDKILILSLCAVTVTALG